MVAFARQGRGQAFWPGDTGSGKTMLCKRLVTILPPLTLAESLQTTQVYSACGQLAAQTPLTATPRSSVITPGL